jgi:hypothetical protein
LRHPVDLAEDNPKLIERAAGAAPRELPVIIASRRPFRQRGKFPDDGYQTAALTDDHLSQKLWLIVSACGQSTDWRDLSGFAVGPLGDGSA